MEKIVNKHIVFLLPTHSRYPIGGFKVVYEYANFLISEGYKVTIVYAGTLLWKRRSLKVKFESFLRYLYYKINQKYTPDNWFELDPHIRLKFVSTLNESNIPVADIIFATSMETAIYLNDYKNTDPEYKFYLIQGFESWNFGEEAVVLTWKFKLNKIVIAEWLKEKVEEIGQKSFLIHNGFDFDLFSRKIPIEKRDKYNVMMLYHNSNLKGCYIGLDAIYKVKEKYPLISLNLFGIPKRPAELPDWVNYYQNPNQMVIDELYNNCSIFLGPSFSEGFNLTVAEAMQCGCAVACTDIGGYTVVCKEGITALTCPTGDSQALAGIVLKLIENDRLRYDIANNAHKEIKNFSWNKAFELMKYIIVNTNEFK